MRFSSSAFLTTAAGLLGFVPGAAAAFQRRLRFSDSNTTRSRHLSSSDQEAQNRDGACTIVLMNVAYEDGTHATVPYCEPAAASEATEYRRILGFSDAFLREAVQQGILRSGCTQLRQSSIEAENPQAILVFRHTTNQTTVSSYQSPFLNIDFRTTQQTNVAKTTGERTVLVVRMEINGEVNTSFTEQQLSDAVFGTDGDPVNLQSQYLACSDEQLHFVPANASGAWPEGLITNGVTTVAVNTSLEAGGVAVRNAVTAALTAMFGVHPQHVAQHVMYCFPPGVIKGAAYAFVNSWLTAYSDKWCTFVSMQMHELGHNLNLHHSSEDGITYEDKSCIMGSSYHSNNGPRMCFNGPKTWQLGWKSDKHANFVVSSQDQSVEFSLVGICDYDLASPGDAVVVRVDSATPLDYYVWYNRQARSNINVREGGDMVLIATQGGDGVGFAESQLVAKLNASGSEFTFAEDILVDANDNPCFFTLVVKSIDTVGNPRRAVVEIAGRCSATAPPVVPTPLPTPAPTITPRPTFAPTPQPTFPGGCRFGNCGNVRREPGCSDATCRDIVCGLDPFCCRAPGGTWDRSCVGAALIKCICPSQAPTVSAVPSMAPEIPPSAVPTRAPVPTSQPSSKDCALGDCLDEHETSGCDVTECQTTVCEVVPWCCSRVWDAMCVYLAETSCDCPASPSLAPSLTPTTLPPTDAPTLTTVPSIRPTSMPQTLAPSDRPTLSAAPSSEPTTQTPAPSSSRPTLTAVPSDRPTSMPQTAAPSDRPTFSAAPSSRPTTQTPAPSSSYPTLTAVPSGRPTPMPQTLTPSNRPTLTTVPSSPPTLPPSSSSPTSTTVPSLRPTMMPLTAAPTNHPTTAPSVPPSPIPVATLSPSARPTSTTAPSRRPTDMPNQTPVPSVPSSQSSPTPSPVAASDLQ